MKNTRLFLIVIIFILGSASNFAQYPLTEEESEQNLSFEQIYYLLVNYKNSSDREECRGSLINYFPCLIRTIKGRKLDFDLTVEKEYELRILLRNALKNENIENNKNIKENTKDLSGYELLISKTNESYRTDEIIDKFLKKLRRFKAKSKYDSLEPRLNIVDNGTEELNEQELLEDTTQVLELYLDSEPTDSLGKEAVDGDSEKINVGRLYLIRAIIYFKQRKFQYSLDEGIKAFSKNQIAFKTCRLIGKSYYEIGMLYEKKDKKKSDHSYRMAEKYFEEAIRIIQRYDDIDVYDEISNVKKRLNKLDESFKYYEKFIEEKKRRENSIKQR